MVSKHPHICKISTFQRASFWLQKIQFPFQMWMYCDTLDNFSNLSTWVSWKICSVFNTNVCAVHYIGMLSGMFIGKWFWAQSEIWSLISQQQKHHSWMFTQDFKILESMTTCSTNNPPRVAWDTKFAILCVVWLCFRDWSGLMGEDKVARPVLQCDIYCRFGLRHHHHHHHP